MKFTTLCTSRHIVLGVAWCAIIDFVFVKSQGDENLDSKEIFEEEEPDEEESLIDNHTFVALIDIVFTDGSKRTCTGTIIHDYVVITAAHCFVAQNNENATPELTASFVVIGTKKMFDTGYEQYLPIERIITHPRFKDWTADLCLVYTFAGMTSDKPGTVIPLAGDKTAPVDSNVSVLSWGRSKGVEITLPMKFEEEEESPATEYSSLEDIKVAKDFDDSAPENVTVSFQTNPWKSFIFGNERISNAKRQHKHRKHQHQTTLYSPFRQRMPTLLKSRDSNNDYKQSMRVSTQTPLSHIISSIETDAKFIDKIKNIDRYYNRKTNKTTVNYYKKFSKLKDTTQVKQARYRRRHEELPQEPRQINSFKSYYKSWRRLMGSLQNKLLVEVFGFVNFQTCKKIVERAMPEVYELSNGNDVVCYTSEDHVITSEDSGAPAIRRGHLVAVTVGGVESDGDHVAVGMKMSCFCSWIADNLPSGGESLNCCKKCCDVKHTEDHIKANNKRKRHKYKL